MQQPSKCGYSSIARAVRDLKSGMQIQLSRAGVQWTRETSGDISR